MKGKKKISIIGTVGLPANYGGFETLVENLSSYHNLILMDNEITVFCSSKTYPEKKRNYLSTRLRYIPLNANGIQSIPYDILSLFFAIWNRTDVILLLGVSGAIVLPVLRLFSSARIITNIDGIEWRRQKWRGLAKIFLRFSEKMAIRFSDEVISDNVSIAEYVKDSYGIDSHVIAYGGDQAVNVGAIPVKEFDLPSKYSFSVCRIEPENNIHIILEAFSGLENYSLVIVGNWLNSDYGRELHRQYSAYDNFYLLDPIYNLGKLYSLRSSSEFYLHGHSAGGTNPSLVEAMHFGVPIIAFDCDFNRSTTENKALYFKDAKNLKLVISSLTESVSETVSKEMVEVAKRRYTWKTVAKQYFNLF
jgi:glycosyltransferase involved in cell wall biosynthesis